MGESLTEPCRVQDEGLRVVNCCGSYLILKWLLERGC